MDTVFSLKGAQDARLHFRRKKYEKIHGFHKLYNHSKATF